MSILVRFDAELRLLDDECPEGDIDYATVQQAVQDSIGYAGVVVIDVTEYIEEGVVREARRRTNMSDLEAGVGIGYTLATGRLFVTVPVFHEWAEKQLGRPIWTHEFGMHDTWDELRESFEHDAAVRVSEPVKEEENS